MSRPVEISFVSGLQKPSPNTHCLIVGQLANLRRVNVDDIACKLETKVDKQGFENALVSLEPGQTDSVQLCGRNFVLASLPNNGSRHNAPMFPHSLTQLIKTSLQPGEQESIIIVCQRHFCFPLAMAVPRAYPLYNRKTTRNQNRVCHQRKLTVEFLFVGDDKNNGLDPLSEDEVTFLNAASDSVRLAAKIVDAPCSEMNTLAFLEEVKAVGAELGIEPMIIKGDDLQERGFGGIYGVGKAATSPPALAVLSHKPVGATKDIAWVGKGIVYDTGGLSIKDKVHMPGMKRDCGGAAGVLGAFKAAVTAGFTENLHCIVCLAENAVGPNATRPDDIHKFYSGKTVEINNTDAEGRLVLADGVAYAAKDLGASIIVDMATLTGAQGISTGIYHAAIVTNNELYEKACVEAGRNSGDLAHPLPFCPELHFSEFNSSVADMKNSVKNRGNAQSSCAGLFIFAHLGFDFPGVWLHIDMASPVHRGERATGYGVALLAALFGAHSKNPLLKSIAPRLL